MRIAIVSDAWFPQVNGVVRTLDTVRGKLAAAGHELLVIGPDRFRTLPCPTYPEIRLALLPARAVAALLDGFQPDAVHIATEGPLGMATRRHCLARGWRFTTSFHTKFAEYLHARTRFPMSWTYAWMRRFHAASERIMVATPSLETELTEHGFKRLARWTRGVDTELFRPQAPALELPRPVFLYVGRVAVEKNIGAFLELPLDGSKLVVGGGPQLAQLKRRYPEVHFVGNKSGQELARHYAAADVFVFPSRTDTFGLVLLEALASGLPVAAYPVTGPRDVIDGAPVGCLNDDLAAAARGALALSRQACRDYALNFTWDVSAGQFLANLARVA
jgi:glycosyltransferase involved in cell wall biosynthesis